MLDTFRKIHTARAPLLCNIKRCFRYLHCHRHRGEQCQLATEDFVAAVGVVVVWAWARPRRM
jgi:hypothetical protein